MPLNMPVNCSLAASAHTLSAMITGTRPRQRFIVVRGEASPGSQLKGAVVAIGNFDGVHRGHRAVIAAARARAEALGCPAAALTFEPHPRSFFRPDEPVFRLTDELAKLRLLAATGLSGAIVLRFDATLARVSAEDFVARVLVERLAVSGVAIGYDFHFGLNRTGSPDYLAAQGAARGFAVEHRAAVRGRRTTGPLRSDPRRTGGRTRARSKRAAAAIPGSSAAR